MYVRFHFGQTSLKQAKKNSFRCQTPIIQGADDQHTIDPLCHGKPWADSYKTATECEYWQLANQQDVHQSERCNGRPQRTEGTGDDVTATERFMHESESSLFSLPFLNTRQGQSRIKVALLYTSNLSSKC